MPFRATIRIAVFASFALVSAALAWDTIVTFDGGAAFNLGAWTYGPAPTYPNTGGNPDWYLRSASLVAGAPALHTTGTSTFTGNFRARRVDRIGVDLRTFSVTNTATGHPLAVMLINNNGTPGDTTDDWAVYRMGANIPVPSDPWKSYDFNVPYESTSLPAGWLAIKLGPAAPTPDWNTAIQDVDEVQFLEGDPALIYPVQNWTIGADNLRIETRAGDINGDGKVNGADLGLLLGNWGGTGTGDLNGDGIVNGADLGILLGEWTG